MAFFKVITGLQGGGKTYQGVEIVLKYLEEGAVIHTNMPLIWERFQDEWPDHQLVKLPDDPSLWVRSGDPAKGEPLFTSDIITGGKEGGGENLVIVDETAIDFGTDNQQALTEKKRLEPIFRLVALLRHVGLDIYFIAQDQADINAKLRRLASARIHCINCSNVPGFGWLLGMYADFKRETYGRKDSKILPGGVTWHNFNPKIGALYKTHGMKERVGIKIDPTREGNPDEMSSLGRGKAVLIAVSVLALVLGGLCVAWYLISPLFKTSAPQELKEEQLAPSSPKQPSKSKPAKPEKESEPTPAEKPRGGLMAVEWDENDEWIITSVSTSRMGLRLSTRNGPSLSVGGDYMGERLESLVQHRGWFYFIGEQGRVVVARPVHPWEREQFRLDFMATITKDKDEPASTPPTEPAPAASGSFLGNLISPITNP